VALLWGVCEEKCDEVKSLSSIIYAAKYMHKKDGWFNKKNVFAWALSCTNLANPLLKMKMTLKVQDYDYLSGAYPYIQ